MNALFFAMPMTPGWTAIDFILLFLMWLVTMIAMMTPSVAPLITMDSAYCTVCSCGKNFPPDKVDALRCRFCIDCLWCSFFNKIVSTLSLFIDMVILIVT